MRILPVNNFVSFAVRTQNINRQNNTNFNLKMSEPLMCDTVSFGENSKNEQKIEINSNKIFTCIDNQEYSEALKLINTLSPEDWNPNFCDIDEETGETISIVERLLINKSVTKKMSDAQKKTSLMLFKKIVNHEEFQPFNAELCQDVMTSCIILDNIPQEYALAFMDSDAFLNMDDDDYRSYYEMARGANKNKIANALAVYILENCIVSDTQFYDEQTQTIGQSSNNAANEVTVEALQARLEEYRFNNANSKGFADVAGMEDIKKVLIENLINPWSPKYQKQIRENRLSYPSGILLSGPTGCGKTFIISATGKEMGCDMYEMDCGNVGSTYVHGTSSEISEVFKNLELLYKKTGKPSILVLDEIDAIGGARMAGDRALHNEEMDVLLKLANNCADKGIILVGATNFPDNIDKALLRPGRMDTKIEMGYPKNREEVTPIVMKYIENRPLADGLLPYIDEISDRFIGLSPALIKNVLEKSMYRAMYDDRQTADMQDFNVVFEQEKAFSTGKSRTPIGFKKN